MMVRNSQHNLSVWCCTDKINAVSLIYTHERMKALLKLRLTEQVLLLVGAFGKLQLHFVPVDD
jgi:hypothetical protein